MTAPDTAPEVFAYLDYRAFLRDWFEARKKANPRYSHRLFARRSGQKSPSLLLHVMNGQRNLTPANVEAFVGAMSLAREEGAFFRALVDLEQATTDEDRNDAWLRIASEKRFREARRVEGDGFRYLSRWYYPAIRELALRRDFEAEPKWIARTLQPRITISQARRALDDMLVMGLLAKEADGRVVQAEASVVTPHEVAGLAVHNYHREMTDRAKDAVDAFEPDVRHLLGVTVCIPADLVPTLKEELNAMQARLLQLCDGAEGDASRVYQMNLQLFPLSEGQEGA